MAGRLFVLIFGLAALCTLVACGSSAENAEETGDATPNVESSSTGTPSVAGVGDTISISSTDTTVDVTLLKITDPAKAFPGSDTPEGMRWITVRLALTNTGDHDFDDSTFVGEYGSAALIDAGGSTFEPTGIGSRGSLQPGDAEQWLATFMVPEDVKPATFRCWAAEWTIDQ